MTILAWHFVGDTLRDGRPVPPDGETLRHDDGPLVLCESGLHACEHLIDALQYAPGSKLCRDECGGEIVHGTDKLVCSERTILWRIDATDLLRQFARQCALDVAHLWKMPDVVRRYLETGDETIMAAARDAAWAGDAAWDATRAGAAARAAARAALAAGAGAGARLAATARDAASASTRAAARAAQNDRLTAMAEAAHAGAMP